MESGHKRKKRESADDSHNDVSDRKKLIQTEHQLGKLQSLLFDLLSSLKNSADSDSLVTLVDPLVNIEIAILRKQLQEQKNLLDAANLSSSCSSSSSSSTSSSSFSSRKPSRFSESGGAESLPLHQELFQKQMHDKVVRNLKDKIAGLEAENDLLQKKAGEAGIQQYLWTIDQRNMRIAEIGKELVIANATIDDLRHHNELLSQQIFSLQAQQQDKHKNIKT
jgi:hypothetical protein